MISVPALMIGGTKDVVCDAKHASQTMERVVEGGKLKVVNLSTGHWIMIEQRDNFNKVLAEWLTETGRDGQQKARL